MREYDLKFKKERDRKFKKERFRARVQALLYHIQRALKGEINYLGTVKMLHELGLKRALNILVRTLVNIL